MSTTPLILVCDDQAMVHEALGVYLQNEGYQMVSAFDGTEALRLGGEKKPDLIILDLMMPQISGIEVCREVRKNSNVPILMLTAKGEEIDRILGLELGADDYVPKTFSARELLARIRVVLRRMENAGLPEGSDRQDGMLCMHGLCMNPQTLKVTLNNEPLDLTSMEFQLLYHLARGAGRIFSREDLLNLFAEKEWNKFDRCVDVHISSLRKKLGDNSRCPTYLKTVRGLGYMFIKQSDAWP